MVFAKSQRAFEHLKEELRVKRVRREYVLLVQGSLREGETRSISGFVREGADGLMKHVPTDNAEASAGAGDHDEGESEAAGAPKHATTHLRVLRTGRTRSVVLATLDTGRKNQIRVHMQAIGRSICGDRRFGSTDDPLGRVCLHAMRLSFAHPVDGRTMQFESAMPSAFLVALGGLREGERIEGRQSITDGTPQGKGEAGATHEQIGMQTEKTKRTAKDKPATRDSSPASSLASSSASSLALSPASSLASSPASSLASSWDHVAGWYDDYIERGPSDHHQQVIVPGTMRLLGAAKGLRVLDVACGQGALCRLLRERGALATGVDAAPGLIDRARATDPKGHYVVGDARELKQLALVRRPGGATDLFDAACCVMALMNIEPLGPVLDGIAHWLRPGGVFVGVMLHPAFRSPGQTSWGWDTPEVRTQRPATNSKAGKKAKFNDTRGGSGRGSEERVFAARDRAMREARSQSWEQAVQYRRVDGYLSPLARGIVMNPGAVARGDAPVTTMTYHRPLQTYVQAFAQAGLLLDAIEEWASVRMSEPGPRATAENRARREIPMFVALRGVRVTQR
jgi:SAM-dependent methyltransferase